MFSATPLPPIKMYLYPVAAQSICLAFSCSVLIILIKHTDNFNFKFTIFKDNSSPLCSLAIIITINQVKTQQFILLYSTTCFGLNGHHQVKHNNIYIHYLYVIEISEPHNLYCYLGIYYMGRIVLGTEFV